MKLYVMAMLLGIAVVSADAKPMTGSVESWEGVFNLSGTNTPIRIAGLPTIRLWRYDLATGSQGAAIGFSTEDGDMLLSPTPEAKGVQPVYLEHVVTVGPDKKADILVVYSVQGNGGWKVVEKYAYDGKSIVRVSRTLNGGKPDFRWFREEDGEQPTPPYSAPAARESQR